METAKVGVATPAVMMVAMREVAAAEKTAAEEKMVVRKVALLAAGHSKRMHPIPSRSGSRR